MQAFVDYLSMNWIGLLVALLIGFLLAWLFMVMPANRRSSVSDQRANELDSKLKASNRNLEDAQKALAVSQTNLSEAQIETQSVRQQLAAENHTLSEARGLSVQQKTIEETQSQQLATAQAEISKLQATLQEKDEQLADANSKLAGPVRLFEKVAGVSANAVSLDHLTPAKAPAIIATIMGGITTKLVQEVQDLGQIPGIGTVSEGKLYEAGIGTYWEIANLTDEELDRILQPSAAQRATLNYANVRTEALKLAQSTESVGSIWNGRSVDDLDKIPGISSVFEQRLYNAGVSTYKDLAGSTVEQLSEICRPTATMMPNYQAWIAKAKELMQASNGAA